MRRIMEQDEFTASLWKRVLLHMQLGDSNPRPLDLSSNMLEHTVSIVELCVRAYCIGRLTEHIELGLG